MRLYLAVTQDEYALPLAVADGPTELARMVGVKPQTIKSYLWYVKNKKNATMYPRYVVVEDGDLPF